MITENGTVKVRTVIDENMQREYSANSNKIALAMLIGGAIGAFVFLVLYFVCEFMVGWDDNLFLVLFFVFVVFLAGGIFLKIVLNKALQQVKSSPKVNEYEFCSDHFVINQISGGETVATVKFYYAQVTKIKETKNYVNIFINQAQVFPVGKADFDENEWNTFKSIFGLNSAK